MNERNTESLFAVSSLVSVNQPVHIDICNWETFSPSASVHTVMCLVVHLGWVTLGGEREGCEMVWPVKTSKLVSPAEEQNRLRLVPPMSQMTGRVAHMVVVSLLAIGRAGWT